MGTEIERRFLVKGDGWKAGARGVLIRQGYLCSEPARTVRVRLSGGRAWLTVKGLTRGASRPEFEYEIPLADAGQLLGMCPPPLLEKTRWTLRHEGQLWEVDEFHGENAGLTIAEAELADESAPLALPAWIGREVTGIARYHNSQLALRPYGTWTEEEKRGQAA